MIDQIHDYVLPAAYSLLPPKMKSDAATAQLIAIGLHESQFKFRAQVLDNGAIGKGRGFWQFEPSGGIAGVLQHRATRVHIYAVLDVLRYGNLIDKVSSCWKIVEHHDTLAAVFARLLLWTLPDALPGPLEVDVAYAHYLEAWRPGRKHPADWPANYAQAWNRVLGTTTEPL